MRNLSRLIAGLLLIIFAAALLACEAEKAPPAPANEAQDAEPDVAGLIAEDLNKQGCSVHKDAPRTYTLNHC